MMEVEVVESMQNSPIAIALAQLVILVINAILYARQKNAVDLEKRERGAFGLTLSEVKSMAVAAERAADRIDTEKYRALASLFEQQAAEIASLKARVAALEESVASLSNKLASRERADKKAEKAGQVHATPAPGRDEDQEAAPSGELDAATLARLGAIPLQPEAAPAASAPRSFGRKVA